MAGIYLCDNLAMPHFYFNVRDGGHLIEDANGSEAPHLCAARALAVYALRVARAELARRSKATDGRAVEITDEDGYALTVVTFQDV